MSASLSMITLIWGLSGFAAYGLTLAEYQKRFLAVSRRHRASDVCMSLFMAALGPFGLAAHLVTVWGDKSCGFLLFPLSDEAWNELARKEFGDLLVEEGLGAPRS